MIAVVTQLDDQVPGSPASIRATSSQRGQSSHSSRESSPTLSAQLINWGSAW